MNSRLPCHAIFLFIFALCFLFASCDRQQPPVRIGLSINLSGRGGEAGEHIRDGALLAVDDINSSGGIKGRPLELLIRDDLNTPEGVIKADESLINEGVVAIIGHSYSSNTVTAYPYVTSRGTLLITAYTATSLLSGKDDLFVRTSVDCALYGRKTAQWLSNKNAESVAVLMDMTNEAFVRDYVASVADNFHGSMTEVMFYSREAVDWTETIHDLLKSDPDSVLLLTEASMTGVALQKLESAGYKGNRLATLWAQTPGLMRHAGSSAEGLSIITFIDSDNRRSGYLKFAADMEKKFHKKATARSTRSYEMIMILSDALRRIDTISAEELKKALLAGKYNTIMGNLGFDAFGDVVRPVYEVVVRNDEFHSNGEL